jgi:hypothetical protein
MNYLLELGDKDRKVAAEQKPPAGTSTISVQRAARNALPDDIVASGAPFL